MLMPSDLQALETFERIRAARPDLGDLIVAHIAVASMNAFTGYENRKVALDIVHELQFQNAELAETE